MVLSATATASEPIAGAAPMDPARTLMASSSSFQSQQRVKRPSEDCREPHIEELQDAQQPQRHSDERRCHRRRPPRQDEQ